MAYRCDCSPHFVSIIGRAEQNGPATVRPDGRVAVEAFLRLHCFECGKELRTSIVECETQGLWGHFNEGHDLSIERICKPRSWLGKSAPRKHGVALTVHLKCSCGVSLRRVACGTSVPTYMHES